MRKNSRKNKMNTAKLGVIFIVAAMALAGVGAGYSAWFDTITVEGTVGTGSVGWHFTDDSGTWAYKVYGDCSVPTGEIYIDHTGDVEWQSSYSGCQFLQVAYSEAVIDPADDHHATVTYYNLFPSIDFEADVTVLYTGTIPGKINDITFTDVWPEDAVEVLIDQYTTLSIKVTDTAGNVDTIDDLAELAGYQLHEGDIIHVVMTIHLPQNDAYMNLNGDFGVEITVVQWNEYPYEGGECGEEEVDVDLVGYWKLDDGTGDTAIDSSENGNDGTLMPDSPVWTSEGIINGALDFDGIDDYVEIPDDLTLDITDEITLMAWVYPESWDHDGYSAASSGDKRTENAIITKADDSDIGVWNLHYKWNDDDGIFGFRFEAEIDGSTENVFEITPSEDLNRWYHIAGVYDGSEIKLYVDGELINSKPVTGPIGTNDMPLRFGKQLWYNDIYSLWDGKMDDIKIYSRALSDTEILNEYCSEKTTITINEPGPQYDNTQYGYVFDYSGADVQFTYCNKDSNLRGIIQATGLKPYCTYQVKLLGKPICQYPSTGDDQANEYIGYNGRWTCVDCVCTGSTCNNRNDAQYEANKALPDSDPSKECIAGYLVFDYFTADSSGNAVKFIEAETSYHVLLAGGGTCDSNNNDDLEYLDSTHPEVYFCQPQNVNGQSEPGRGGCGGLTLDSDDYHCTIALTEESFHQGNWATVLEGTIDFEIS